MTVLYLAGFGLVGIFLRFGIDQLTLGWSSVFPFGTLIINASGSLFAGVIYAASLEKGWLTHDLRVGLLVGFCGGLTTFSAFSLQILLLFEQRRIPTAIFYALFSPVAGSVFAFVGAWLGRLAFSR